MEKNNLSNENWVQTIFNNISPLLSTGGFVFTYLGVITYTIYYWVETNFFSSLGVPSDYVKFDKDNYLNFVASLIKTGIHKDTLQNNYVHICISLSVITPVIFLLAYASSLKAKDTVEKVWKWLSIFMLFIIIPFVTIYFSVNALCVNKNGFCNTLSTLYYKYKDPTTNNSYYCKLIRKYGDNILCQIKYSGTTGHETEIKMLKMNNDETFENIPINAYSLDFVEGIDQMRVNAGKLPLRQQKSISKSTVKKVEFLLGINKYQNTLCSNEVTTYIDTEIKLLELENFSSIVVEKATYQYRYVELINDLIYRKLINDDIFIYGVSENYNLTFGNNDKREPKAYVFKTTEDSIQTVNEIIEKYKIVGCKEAQDL